MALLADALLGDPAWLYRRVPHPAAAIGSAISRVELWLLKPTGSRRHRRLAGAALLAIVAGTATIIGIVLSAGARQVPAGWLVEGLLMSTLLAQRSLVEHVRAVAGGPARAGSPRGAARSP